MDTFKLYVFSLTCITLIFVQTNVDAALGDDCSVSNVCEASNNEFCTGTTCVCADGFYENGTSCASNNALKPINLQSNTKTYNSVTLSWISPAAPDYTNSHVINYNELGGTVKTHNVNGQDTFTLIPSLKAGTTYTFTVVRSIIKDGRNQEVPASDPYTVTTNGVYSNSCTSVGSSTECGPGLVCMLGPENQCLCTTGNYFTGSSCAAKKLYGDMCTPGSTNECLTGLACDSDVNKCLCPLGSYYTTTCSSNNDLKPVNLQSNSKTYNSVSLTWTSPDAPGYTNSYDINYIGQGGDERTHTVNNQDQFTTVPNLNRGTTYTFTVVRSITRQGRKQAVPVSDSYPVTTYLIYLDSCTTVDSSTECGPGLVCVLGQENKCLCTSGNYFTGSNCISTDGLRPSISPIQPTSTSSVTVTWTSPSAAGYTNSFDIKYAEVGTSNFTTIPVSDVSTHTVTGLKAGTFYNFIVVRSITREERTQTGIESYGVLGASEKLDYGESCVSNGTCKNLNTDCYSSTCRCNPGYFWKDTLCFTNANLSPIGVVSETRSTTQLRVTWTASAFTDIVTGYKVELSPLVSSDNIVINGTSATISSLRPGERYGITVSSKSNYLDRGETAAAGVVFGNAKPAAIIDLAPSTSLMEPTAQIYFHKAKGRADTYTVTLTGVGSNSVENPSGPEDVLSTNFSGVSAGSYYDLTIITVSYGVSSDPFSRTIRVRAEASEAVVDLKVFDPTSRAASLSWKRPINTKGALYKYTIEVFNSSTCVERINIQCTECLQPMNISETTETSCGRETNTTINKSNLNDVNFLVRYDLSLLPDTHYTVVVIAYNEEGKGQKVQDTVYTQQEAAGDPTGFRHVDKTSESVELTWTPPEPRPGVTIYMITVYEWDEDDQYTHFKNDSTLGFYNVSINVTGLSSYWKYSFEMFARTFKGDSNTTNVVEVTTDESAPTAVENLEHQPVDGVYNKYQLSWKCPPQKDGRNGVIRNATVITSSLTKSVDSPQIGSTMFDNTDCMWNEQISVTPEFNYTFEVYISNSINGESTTIQRYMPAGPASLSRDTLPAGQTTSSTELTMISISFCPSCVLDPKNGRVKLSGIIVCKGSCNTNRRKRQAKTQADYENFKTWPQSKKNSLNDPYRATSPGWLASLKDSGSIEYIIGNDTKCADKSETTFCNGPLEEGTTYKIIVFACTSAGCDETEEVSISTAETPSNIGGIIGGVVGVLAGVFVVIIAVIVVRRRRARPTTFKRKLDDHSDDEELILKKRPIQIKNFEKRVEEMHKDSNLLFSEEFEDINALSPKEKCIASETNGNKLKNRYVNILPFDATRVKLRQTEEDEEGSDYINANYIPGYSSPREYIATQGPMTGTITDFWRMIWEQNVPIIIMLSDLQEKGKPKVDRYYPEDMEPVQYGDIVLEMTNFSPLNKYVIRIFKLQVGEEVRMVRHYFLPGWQDFGANLNSDDVIDFVKNVRREIKPNNTGPMCVHCSAGVGRTGTYIALDVFQQHIDEEKLDKEIDIFDFVLKMRYNRSYMVQTEKQYIFIHDTIKEMVIKKKNELAERDNIYMNNENTGGDDIYVNQAFETDPQDIYMNVDNSSGKPTTVL